MTDPPFYYYINLMFAIGLTVLVVLLIVGGTIYIGCLVYFLREVLKEDKENETQERNDK